MDISGLVQSYDMRAASSAAMSRTVMAPQYGPVHPYTGAPSHDMVATHHQLQQQNPFTFNAYSGANPTTLVPAFANHYVQQRPLPPLTHALDNGARGVSYSRVSLPGYAEDHQSQSPLIKAESTWNSQAHATPIVSPNVSMHAGTEPANDAKFGTEVDTLMRAIQAKSQPTEPQTTEQNRTVVGASRISSPQQTTMHANLYAQQKETEFKLMHNAVQEQPSPRSRGSKKRYQCTIEDCHKSFYQKTHLDIHERAHTGHKPYPCKECGQNFSQLGNLRTHQRRHTGERPYPCEICGKTFAQRGNVRAHKIVHGQAKPYLCRLENCGKRFSQLGNLKSHQNKFHIENIRQLTAKFASVKEGDIVSAADREIWDYFANLYKNSNKGIKGRGKDRKVGPNTSRRNEGMRGLHINDRGAYMGGPGRDNLMIGAGMGSHPGMRKVEGMHYDMYDVGDGSQSGHSGSGGASSVGSCYDDAACDGYEDAARSNALAFGDRIY